MAEITGLKCNGCQKRIFLEDDESVHWATMRITVPASKTQMTIHYCPQCGGDIINGASKTSENLDTGKRQVVSPAYQDPTLQAMLTHDDGQYAVPASSTGGVPAPTWNAPPPNGRPDNTMPAPVSLPATSMWDPAATSGVPVGPGRSRGNGSVSKRRVGKGGNRQRMTEAITQTSAWLPHAVLTFGAMLAVALHVSHV